MSSPNQTYEILKLKTNLPTCLCKIISEYNYLDLINKQKIYLNISKIKYGNENEICFNFPILIKNYFKFLNYYEDKDLDQRNLLILNFQIEQLIIFINKINSNKIFFGKLGKIKIMLNKLNKILKLFKKIKQICIINNEDEWDDTIEIYDEIVKILKYFKRNKKLNSFLKQYECYFSKKKHKYYTYDIELLDLSYEDIYIFSDESNYETAKKMALYYGLNNNENHLITQEDEYY